MVRLYFARTCLTKIISFNNVVFEIKRLEAIFSDFIGSFENNSNLKIYFNRIEFESVFSVFCTIFD